MTKEFLEWYKKYGTTMEDYVEGAEVRDRVKIIAWRAYKRGIKITKDKIRRGF